MQYTPIVFDYRKGYTMAGTVKLQETERLVIVQFSASKDTFVPEGLKGVNHETPQEAEGRAMRKAAPSGVQVVEPVENTGIADLLNGLEEAGYEMVDAFHQPRLNRNNGRTYHMVRFTFARHEDATPSEEFVALRDQYREAMREVITSAAWRVQAYLNPFFSNGEVVEGQYAVSLNMVARVPLLLPDGSPVAQWERDDAGEKVGDAPVPITPDFKLSVSEKGEIAVSPYKES